MHHLLDEPTWAASGPAPFEALLPAAGAMSALCLMLFCLLLFI